MAYQEPLTDPILEITNRCNLRCPHCASNSGEPRENELSVEEWKVVIDQIAELGGQEVTLIGGEALLHPHWDLLADYVRGHGMDWVLLTNGIPLVRNETMLRRLRQTRPKAVGVSIDGATPESYRRQRGVDAFDDLVALCKRLQDDGHESVNVITTFNRTNLHDFDGIADLVEGTGLGWQFQIASKAGTRFSEENFVTLDDYRWLVDRVRHVVLERPEVHIVPTDDFGYFPMDPAFRFLHQSWGGCEAGRHVVGIRANGDVLPCLSLGDEFVVANLRRDGGLVQIWTSDEPFHMFRNKVPLLQGACASCAYASRCMAGCPAIAISATGRFGDNPYCIRRLETEELAEELQGVLGRDGGAQD